ncbi:hypothetical protein Tco_0978529 [Tanacetum coccineum]|uniref:Uncharacterized protein n=1 Tax=Tanacetum coccineum TaxID=301880 RepID=A0ABQ5ENM4_9ASTR
MLDVALVPINEQVKISASNFRISLKKIQPDVIYKELSSQKYYFTMGDQVIEVNADLLCNALSITPKDLDHPFAPPASEKEIIRFINKLRCPNPIKIVSALRVNDLYQPWRTFLTMINRCLTGKASAYHRPRLLML